ncbi:hypothetical protein [Mastigocladopsis repens]|uniref:hypothetical protein n=1 Tax=Mastigocladopsis repens TaxID=221287 RepID=UPI00030FD84E|nr:hypothetical protein [Mastigocladopsis repens]
MVRDSNQLNIRVDEEIKKAFIRKAKEEGTTATDLLVNYMKQYLGILPNSPSDEMAEMKKRLLKLEQVVLGESAA